MTTYFVSRHQGALGWARKTGIAFDVHVDHLEPSEVQQGDTVIGTLPVPLAAQICERGARYLHLVLPLPRDLRGAELDADTLTGLGARVEEYRICRAGRGHGPE